MSSFNARDESKRTTIIDGKTYDEERALYNLTDAKVINCRFAGPADGESALKEARSFLLKDSSFSLRYPLWHCDGYELVNVKMDELTRAPMWYSKNGRLENCNINSIKIMRECENIDIVDSTIVSHECGWESKGINIKNSKLTCDYFLMHGSDIVADNMVSNGKYIFQYAKNIKLSNCDIVSKDCFWHADNVVVRDSILRGEYLAWFSNNVTLINCTIEGVQPFCYCKNLKLVNCKMVGTNWSFEYSENIDADVVGDIMSIRNPKSGKIVCDSVGEVDNGHRVMTCNASIIIRGTSQKTSTEVSTSSAEVEQQSNEDDKVSCTTASL